MKKFNRSAGVLLNVSSLPSPYGIGGFGRETDELSDFLLRGGFHYWQILPLNTVGLGDSPYSGTSAFAGNYLYIDPEKLRADGALTEADVRACEYPGEPFSVDYAFCRGAKRAVVRKAFASGAYAQAEIDEYCRKNRDWLDDYAVYMAVKDMMDGLPWWRWEEPYRLREPAALNKVRQGEEYAFYCFEQFLRKGRTLNILGLLLACIGIYLLTTRQVIFAAILCMAYAMFALKKIKLNSFVFIIIFCYIVYMYSQNLFGYFIEMTEGIDKDYVRFLSYRFFGLDYNDGQVLPFLIGNGMWSDSSEYGYDMLRYADYGLHQSDIGIVGMYSLYGIFYVIVIILFFIYLIKRFKYIDVYLRMYAIYMLITSIMLHHFGSSSYKIMILCCYIYLVEKSVIYHKSIKQQITLYGK